VVDWIPEDERPTGEVWCDYASGEMSNTDRRRLLQRLGTVTRFSNIFLASDASSCLTGITLPVEGGMLTS
jgi:hypothetical protein